MTHRLALAAAALAASVGAAGPAAAQRLDQPYEGYLCCNMRSDGSWVSDINYQAEGKQLLAAGTKLKVTGYGRWRVLVEIDGKAQALGNDYSRTLDMEAFAKRYVLAEDPTRQLADAPPKVREAVKAGKVTRGMTRQQVAMAVGYPITSYNENLEAPLWRYWLDRSTEWQVFWNEQGRVDQVFGSPEARAKVWLD